ncbi:hypothetical protein FSST1_005446 [Fusarium sambucinum]
MAYTRSRRKAATPVPTSPSSPTSTVRQESPLQTPEPLARPLKRKRNRDVDDSTVPLKLRKKSTAPPETSQTRTRLSKTDSESDPSSRNSQGPTGPDAAISEENESGNGQHPAYAHVHKLFKHDVVAKDASDANQHTDVEYFQAFPHDPQSTLCVEHFLSLAEKWYWNRKPTVHSQLAAIPRDTTTVPDFSNLALPVCEETWTIKDFQSFKDELSEKITNTTKSAYIREYYRVAHLTGCKPRCEIFDTSAVACCSMCAQSPDFQPPADGTHDTFWDMQSFEDFMANDDRMIRETTDECKSPVPVIPQGLDEEMKDEYKTFLLTQGIDLESPRIKCDHETSVTILGTDDSYTECEDCGRRRRVSSSRLRTRNKVMHIDVGGIHIVVDHCKAPLIRFRSTHFSQAHEKYGFDYHDQGEIEVFDMPEPDNVYSRTGAFNPTFCSRSFEDCACD